MIEKTMIDCELLQIINEEKGCLLVKAIERQNIEAMQFLIKSGADIYEPLNYNEVPPVGLVFKLTGVDNDEFICKFLELIADITREDCYQNNLLHYACMYNHPNLVQPLIDQGVDVNGRNQFNGTPLFDAVIDNHFECAAILLANGAKVNVNDFDGETPLSCAVSHEDSESVHLLLNHGANVHSLDNEDQTPLFSAARSSQSNMDLLLVNGADINAVDRDGNTVLLKAIEDKFTDNALHLVHHGADINHKNKMGLTPIFYALHTKNVECVEALLNRGADLDIKYGLHAGVKDLVTIDDISRIAGTAEIYKMISSYRENKKLSQVIISNIDSCQMPCF